MIAMVCPHCGNRLSIPEGYAGKSGKCKKCGGHIAVPRPQTHGIQKEARAIPGEGCSTALPDAQWLCDPNNWLAVRMKRKFAQGSGTYDSKAAASDALRAAHEIFPTVANAYVPSGKTTSAAVALIVLSSLPLAGVLATVWALVVYALNLCVVVPVMFIGKLFGGLDIVGACMALLFCVPAVAKAWVWSAAWLTSRTLAGLIGHRFSNRTASVPATAACVVVICATCILAVHGLALARGTKDNDVIHGMVLGFVFLAGVGVWAARRAAVTTASLVRNDPYCELTNMFLPRARSVSFELRFAEDFLSLLASRDYEAIGRLNVLIGGKKTGSRVQFTLYANEEDPSPYAVGYVDVVAIFREVYSSPFPDASPYMEDTWLTYSARADQTTIQTILRVIH